MFKIYKVEVRFNGETIGKPIYYKELSMAKTFADRMDEKYPKAFAMITEIEVF